MRSFSSEQCSKTKNSKKHSLTGGRQAVQPVAGTPLVQLLMQNGVDDVVVVVVVAAAVVVAVVVAAVVVVFWQSFFEYE